MSKLEGCAITTTAMQQESGRPPRGPAGDPPAWEWREGGAVLRLSGEWRSRRTPPAAPDTPPSGTPARLTFDTSAVTGWDSSLAIFVAAAVRSVTAAGGTVDASGLPAPLRGLLDLVASAPPPPQRGAPPPRHGAVTRLGEAAIRTVRRTLAVTTFLGETTIRAVATLRRRSQIRRIDVLTLMRDAGAAALPIVTIVNVLVGGILAFVGAVQLQQFGAGLLVADLVGIAMAREMAAVMTAIVMAGRTGGAYAAHLATMQGNEEIDAFTTFGVSPIEHLVVPRVLALTLMMPLLYAYGCAVGLIGGMMVGVAVLDLTPIAYVEETRAAVDATEFVIGFIKSATFGALVAVAGCYLGLGAGRSAADVGRAATSAVVAGIIGIIALDAIFAVVTHFAGI